MTATSPQLAPPSASYQVRTYNMLAHLWSTGTLATLNGSAVSVLLVLLLRYNWRRGAAWPSIATIMHEAGLGRDTVVAALAELEHAKLITPMRSSGKASVYLLSPGMRQLADTPAWTTPTPLADPIGTGRKKRGRGAPNPVGKPDRNMEVPLEQEEEQADPDEARPPAPADENMAPAAQPAGVVAHGDHLEVDQEPAPRPAITVLEGGAPPAGEELPRELQARLVAAGVRRFHRVARYGAERLAEALTMLGEAKAREAKGGREIENPAGWLMTCLEQGWKPKAARPKAAPGSAAAEDAIEATRQLIAGHAAANAALQGVADTATAREQALGMLVTSVRALGRTVEEAMRRNTRAVAEHGFTAEEIAQAVQRAPVMA